MDRFTTLINKRGKDKTIKGMVYQPLLQKRIKARILQVQEQENKLKRL